MDYTIVAASIDEVQAAEIRARLASFVEPEMNAYNNYDEAKAKLQN